MSRPCLSPLILLCLLAGCSPAVYRDWADRDAQRLIKDRQLKTTGYTPEVKPTEASSPLPPKRAYAAVPVTRNPDILGGPIRPNESVVSAGLLGPPKPQTNPLPQVESEVLQQAAEAQRRDLTYGPAAAIGRSITLDLFGAVRYAVQHSREYQTRSEDLFITALDVTLQRYLFTPRPFVRTGLNYNGGQQDVAFRSAYSITQRAGIRQQLPYGGEIVAEGLVSFVNALNDNVADGENAQIALSGSIPLWRGAGLVNLEPLIRSERELVYTTRAFETFRRAFAVEVSTRFFRLQTRYASLRNRFINYRNLSDLVERTEALFAAGRVNALELQRVQQSLLAGEDSLNGAQQNLETELDTFKLLIGMPIDQPLDLASTEVQVAALDTLRLSAEQLALRYRLDLQTVRDRVLDASRGVYNAENGLAPELNLTASSRLNNVGGTPARELDSRGLDYDAGLTLDLPVDRLPERNTYRRSLINLEQARRLVVDTQERVISDVRSAERNIRSAQSSLVIQRASINLAQRRLDFANESLLLGRTTNSRDSVEAQSSLLNAQDAYDRAHAELQIQMLQYLRDTGTLRVDPGAGTLGLAMQRIDDKPVLTTQPAGEGL